MSASTFSLLCLFCAVMLWPLAADATEVFKCRDARGQSHYQAAPCGEGMAQAWVRNVEAPVAGAESHAQPDARVAKQSSSTRRAQTGAAGAPNGTRVRRNTGGHAQGAAISIHQDPAACEKAKADRDRAQEKLGLRRRFLDGRRLDDKVHAACR